MKPEDRAKFREKAADLLARAGFVLTPAERGEIEIADLALGRFEVEGVAIVVYINNDRYCGKELILLPGQTNPQHRHPPVGSDPGKMETFRCRWGKVTLCVEGPPTDRPRSSPPAGSEAYYTVFHEVELNPGHQYTIAPGVWHWFQAGADGAVITEFSSTSRDEFDEFVDPRIRRSG